MRCPNCRACKWEGRVSLLMRCLYFKNCSLGRKGVLIREVSTSVVSFKQFSHCIDMYNCLCCQFARLHDAEKTKLTESHEAERKRLLDAQAKVHVQNHKCCAQLCLYKLVMPEREVAVCFADEARNSCPELCLFFLLASCGLLLV